MTEPEKRIDDLVDELERRVDRRRQEGGYPEGLERDLESRFAALRRAAVERRSFDPFGSALERQRIAGHFARDRIALDSSMPGGGTVHRAVGAAVRRQVDGLLDQMQQFSDAVNETSALLGSMLADPPFHHHDDLRGDLDMVDDRLTRLERTRSEIDVLGQQVHDLEREVRSVAGSSPQIDSARFAREFRGDPRVLKDRYEEVADRFVGLSPVVDVGCGDGEFLTLLAERDVTCWGVEVDAELAESAASRGHQIRVADGVEVIENLGDSSLGGIVLLQVVEHLPPAAVPRVVAEAARVLRPGGVLYVETPNPESVFVHTHSLWLDPSHQRPVHPLYLGFLCRQEPFSEIDVVYSSPVPDDQALPNVPDDGTELSATLGVIVERINRVLFGPQDYAIIATR